MRRATTPLLFCFAFAVFFLFPNSANAAFVSTSPTFGNTHIYVDDTFNASWGSNVYYYATCSSPGGCSSWMSLSPVSSSGYPLTASGLGWGTGWHQLLVLSWDNGAWVQAGTPWGWFSNLRPPITGTLSVSPSSATLNQGVNFSWSGTYATYYLIGTYINSNWTTWNRGNTTSWSPTPSSLGLSAGNSYTFYVQACNTDSAGAVKCGSWVSASPLQITEQAPTSVSVTVPSGTVYAGQQYTLSWSQSGGTGTISYTAWIDGVQTEFGSATSWTGSSPAGTYTYEMRACSSGGCSPIAGPYSFTVVASACSSYSGGSAWGGGCTSGTVIPSTSSGGTYTVYNSNPTYTTTSYATYSCSNGTWSGPTDSSCTLNAPTSAGLSITSSSYSISVGDYVTLTGGGGSGTITSYNGEIGGVLYEGYTAAQLSAGVLTGPFTPAGTYTLAIQACNSGGCSFWKTGTSIVVNYSCTGTTPTNATLCSGDDTGLSANTAKTVVNSCTATKCEYTCNTGYTNIAGTCYLNTYLISYYANGATSGSPPANQTKNYGQSITLSTNSGNLAKTGYTFSGWNTSSSGTGVDYAPESTYSDNSGLILYAKWTSIAPTSAPANITASKSSVGLNETLEITWSPVTGATRYETYNDVFTTPENAGSGTSWTGTLLNLGAGSHIIYIKACNLSGCGPAGSMTIEVLATPSAPTVTVSPSPVGLNETLTAQWSVSTNATRYEYKSDVAATPVAIDASLFSTRTYSATPATYSFTSGAHSIYIRGCNSATNCGSWSAPANFNVSGQTTVSVSWESVLGATYYNLYADNRDVPTTGRTGAWTSCGTPPAGDLCFSPATGVTITGTSKSFPAEPNTSYDVSVWACNSVGCSTSPAVTTVLTGDTTCGQCTWNGDVRWGSNNCVASYTGTVLLNTSFTRDNDTAPTRAPGYTGSVTYTCTNTGWVEQAGSTCTAMPQLSCGTAAKTYTYDASGYGTDSFCATATGGSPNPTAPPFPTPESPTQWTCEAAGKITSPTCTAYRSLACGTAHTKTYDYNVTVYNPDTQCPSGSTPSSTAFPSVGGGTQWTCGATGKTPSGTCAASRSSAPTCSWRYTTGCPTPPECTSSTQTQQCTRDDATSVSCPAGISCPSSPGQQSRTCDGNPTACTVTPFTITPSAGLGGTISPSGQVSVQPNASQLFTFLPSSGYRILAVLVDGVSVGSTPTQYEFTNVTANHTIRVTFEPINAACVVSSVDGGKHDDNSPGTGGQLYSWNYNDSANFSTTQLDDGITNQGGVTATNKMVAVKLAQPLATARTFILYGDLGSQFSVGYSMPTSVVDGACGSANGVGVSFTPTANLCSAGTESAVSGNGPWSWTCSGSGGGANASCSAPVGTFSPSFAVFPAVFGKTTWNLSTDGPLTLNSGGIWTITPLSSFSASVRMWGAGGGSGVNGANAPGGGGGYSAGTVAFTAGTEYKLIVGQGGLYRETSNPVGYGYGGRGSTFGGGAGGGGSAIALDSNNTPILVAGGGGGGGSETGNAGAGGGTNGQDGSGASGGGAQGITPGTGVLQESPATAWSSSSGGNGGWGTAYSGGGGGGYAGGGAMDDNNPGGGGGGSGYVNTAYVTGGSTTAGSYSAPANSAYPDRGTAGAGSTRTDSRGGAGLIKVWYASEAPATYTLTYTAGANGSITGTSPQTVSSGGSGTAVTAVPSAGYAFVNWSDGSTANPRTDTNVTANKSVTASFTAAASPYVSATCVGNGVTETTVGNYKICKFTEVGSNRTFDVTNGGNVEVLVVGGGGGGGSNDAGGGGAGGFLYEASHGVTAQTYPVVVGVGGAGAGGGAPNNGGGQSGSAGSNSSFDNMIAIGGGGGQGANGGVGSSGGSGGGDSRGIHGGGFAGTPGQGNAGAANPTNNIGGGGGGAGAAGSGKNGGIGRQSNISGTTTYYAGGGGGGDESGAEGGLGGQGGGGQGGGSQGRAGQNGTPNTGGGGGSDVNGDAPVGNGGSGIVIIKYQFQ